MANITRMNVMITANSKGLTTGLSKAEMAVRSFSSNINTRMSGLGKTFASTGGVIGAGVGVITSGLKSMALGATAAGVALGYLAMKSIDAVGDANDFAKSVGISYRGLKILQMAAGLAGVETSAFNSSLAKMSDTLGTAFGGNQAAIDSFEKIGLDIEKLKQMAPEQQFEAIGNAINKIQDPAQKIAAARDIFGKSGGALISLFGDVSGSIASATHSVDMFGIGLGQIDVEKIDAAGDSIGILSTIFEGVGNQLARVVAPYISQVVNDTIAWIDEMGGVGPAVDAGFGYAVDVMDELLNVVEEIELAWIKATQAVNDFYLGIYGNDPNSDLEQKRNALMTDKRLQGIAPDKREEFARRLEASGGFQSESPNAAAFTEQKRMNEDYGARVAEIEKRRSERGTLGQRFAKWRAGADANANVAAGVVAPAAPVEYKAHVDNGYMDKIPQGVPNYISKMTPGASQNQDMNGGSEETNLLRQIAQNTGKNAVGFAG